MQDMTTILQHLSDRYLTLLSDSLPDDIKDKFLSCKKAVEQMSCSGDELQKAESFLYETAKQYGLLIIHGDLLRYILYIFDKKN